MAEAEKREKKMVEKAGTRNIADRENKIEILLKEGSTREKYVLCGCILLAAVLGIGLCSARKEINMTNRRWSKSHREKR